jgi:enterochelin esterase-like enzyme
VTHHTYFSGSMKHDVGYCIYLPPDYLTATAARYPVIYNLHGAGGNELHGFEEAQILDRGIRSGKFPPMILVMPNGGKATLYKDSHDGKFMGETTIVKELIPHIDKSYRTIAARHGRCIEGFSMGGRGSTRLAMKYPDMFCSLFNQSGNVAHVADSYPNAYLGPDKKRYIDNDAYLLLTKNLDRIKGRLRIQMWCGTQDPGHLPTVREFHQALLAAGVDHTYMEIEGLAHKRTEMVARYHTKDKTLREIHRVLKTEGCLHLLDFGGPEGGGGNALSRWIQSRHRLKENSEARVLGSMANAGFPDPRLVDRRTVLSGLLKAVFYRAAVRA